MRDELVKFFSFLSFYFRVKLIYVIILIIWRLDHLIYWCISHSIVRYYCLLMVNLFFFVWWLKVTDQKWTLYVTYMINFRPDISCIMLWYVDIMVSNFKMEIKSHVRGGDDNVKFHWRFIGIHAIFGCKKINLDWKKTMN